MSKAQCSYRPPRSTPGQTAAEAGNGDPRSWTDRKRCSGCKRVKPLERFWRDKRSRTGRRSRCIRCSSIENIERWHTEANREWYAAYRMQEDVRAKNLETVKRYQRRNAEKVKAYGSSLRRRMLDARWRARWRLERAKTETSRERIARTIAAYDRELARMDAARDAG